MRFWVQMTLAAALSASHLAAQTSPPPFPPTGKLIAVDGRRVHLYCSGVGSPAVIVAGSGYSFDWALVQAEAARFVRVCTVDPSGTAWSDPGPAASCAGRASELHKLLANAGMKGPFVLVGLSAGALVARFYAAQFESDVAGMVIVDHAFEPPASAGATPANTITLRAEDISDFTALPTRSQQLHRWAGSQHPALFTAEAANSCRTDLARMTDGANAPLGTRPLAVISTGNQSDGYAALQGQLLTLSRDSKPFLAGHSFHSVEIDQPEVVIRAIREVVEAVRTRRPISR